MKTLVSCVYCILIIISFCGCSNYKTDTKDTYIPCDGAIDIYNASKEELIKQDFCKYDKTFGEVKNEKKAVEIARKVIMEVYKNDEKPYIVKFNKNANSWIVNGSLPPLYLGGVASIAIEKDTGKILMLIHTK